MPSQYPPVHLFEDIGDPEDWDTLADIESLSNPRLDASLGNLANLKPEHRASGAGASYLVSPFFHASVDRPGRYHSDGYGALYIAKTFETALAEVAYHQELFLAATDEPPGWTGTFRVLVGKLDRRLRDGRGDAEALHILRDLEDYTRPQKLAAAMRSREEWGIVYPSARRDGGECAALFRVDGLEGPVQADHLRYHWNGERIDIVEKSSGTDKAEMIRL
ncbi:MAG: RES family NAD+ phosphorylase [Pseudomonadota bacterium]